MEVDMHSVVSISAMLLFRNEISHLNREVLNYFLYGTGLFIVLKEKNHDCKSCSEKHFASHQENNGEQLAITTAKTTCLAQFSCRDHILRGSCLLSIENFSVLEQNFERITKSPGDLLLLAHKRTKTKQIRRKNKEMAPPTSRKQSIVEAAEKTFDKNTMILIVNLLILVVLMGLLYMVATSAMATSARDEH
ncbi:unnamed protein product [Thelazia callipaeda]|uniref:Coiled-coil domain-containing protein 167 n=1 Tax=Thelazia callipaeda TaxID=103827 RepID=A0A0N5D0N2_THECL|nr:unnamed protein product [Thelazia callipaeda]